MKFTIEINDIAMQRLVMEKIATDVAVEYQRRYSQDRHEAIRAMADTWTKELYKDKDRLIDLVVDRASKEIVRKGMGKFLDRMREDG